MKELIRFLLEEQGFSYGTLSLKSGIKKYKLYDIIYTNRNYLNKEEINVLKSMFDNGPYKLGFNHVKVSNSKISNLDSIKFLLESNGVFSE